MWKVVCFDATNAVYYVQNNTYYLSQIYNPCMRGNMVAMWVALVPWDLEFGFHRVSTYTYALCTLIYIPE